MTREEMLRLLTAAYTGPGSAAEGTFAGDVLRACADGMAQLWSMEIDGLERRAFVSSAVGEWLTAVCADRGCVRKEGETDEELRARTLAALASLVLVCPSKMGSGCFTAMTAVMPFLVSAPVKLVSLSFKMPISLA